MKILKPKIPETFPPYVIITFLASEYLSKNHTNQLCKVKLSGLLTGISGGS